MLETVASSLLFVLVPCPLRLAVRTKLCPIQHCNHHIELLVANLSVTGTLLWASGVIAKATL